MSHMICTPLSVVRSRATMGDTGCTTSWSTLITRSPDCMAALEKDPLPAKSSMKRGGESCETVAAPPKIGGECCETVAVPPKSQSVWVQR